ncbi:MAG TPA: nuclear transport factor 2 family protein, partial [Thioalkalivibrio sp.]|nr:nuclear transport factor 2 family protein [Thioalkalivibrio sp.]
MSRVAMPMARMWDMARLRPGDRALNLPRTPTTDQVRNMRLYESSEQVEAAFYDAFERADMDVMREVWANDKGISCIHPGGERLDG